MTKIKICGLSRPEDIDYVNEAEPDYCGFIIDVPSSRRNVASGQVRRLRQKLSPGIKAVGVFVNAAPELVLQLLEDDVIDMAQLHGQESEEYIAGLRHITDKPLVKAFSVRTVQDLERAGKSSADMVLLDHGKGGTGQSFDWSVLDKWSGRPFFLAGGLNPDNLPYVIRRYHPAAVDLSSSVETDGQKDREKILAAVAAVRRMKK